MCANLIALCLLASFGASSCCSTPGALEPATEPVTETFTTLTLDQLFWSDDIRVAGFVREATERRGPVIIGHCKEWAGFAPIKEFTRVAGRTFRIVGENGDTYDAVGGVGGFSSSDGAVRCVSLRLRDIGSVDRSKTYQLIPENTVEGFTWVVTAELEPPLRIINGQQVQ